MFQQFFDNIIPSLEHFQTLGYWVAFFAAFLETAFLVGLFIPGSTVLLLLGAYSVGGHLDWGDLLFFAIAGAILGDNLNYWLGRRYGHRWVENGIGFITPQHFAKSHHFFQAHGGKSVFLGRFIPSIKELAPFVAGAMEMPPRKFMLWNILGATGWGIEWLGAGYLFAQSLNLAHIWISRIGMAVLLMLLVSIVFWFFKRWVIRHGQPLIALGLSILRSIKTAVENNHDVQQLVHKHPRFFNFMKKRLDKTHFFGLPVTLLGLAFLYVLMLFAGIVEDFITSDPIIAVDHHVAQLLAVFHESAINSLFYWITELGIVQIVLPLLLIATMVLWLLRKPVLILPLLVSSLGAFAFSMLGKRVFHRPRPEGALLLEQTYSFPSVLYPPHWQSKTAPVSIQLETGIAQQLIDQNVQYTQTFLGEAQQPLSVALLLDNETQLLTKLHQSGWQDADKPDLDSLLRLSKEGMAYTTPPLAPGFWNKHLNDYALEKPWRIEGKPAIITLRLWKTPYRLGDKIIMVGTVRAYDRMQWGLLHHVYPDIDSSRDVLLQSSQQTGALKAYCERTFTPVTTNHYLLGGQFFTHRTILLLDLTVHDQSSHALFCPTE